MTALANQTHELTHSPPSGGASMDIATTRSAQEVQAAMVVAKRFPRDINQAYTRIMESCKRPLLADNALYAYPRGGQTVTGPSIRLAEVLAQSWGNLDFGIIELDQKSGESQVMAYCWDLETNTRQTKIFTVKHERHKKGGKIDKLTDPRDIYEMAANQGARRLRACILGVIPGDIIDEAVHQCEQTMQGGSDEPISDRIRKMVAAFDAMSVKVEMIEGRLGHKLEATTEAELAQLKKVYKSLNDGMSKPGDWFDYGDSNRGGAASSDLSDALNAEDSADPKRYAAETEATPYDQLVHQLMDKTGAEAEAAAGAISRALAAQEVAQTDITESLFNELTKRIDAGGFDNNV